MKVKDIMSKRVIYFKPEDSIFRVAKVFSRKRISGAPVIEKGKVIGVISETDLIKLISLKLPKVEPTHEPHMLSLLILSFLRNTLAFKKELKKISKIKVKDFMSQAIISISPEANLLEAAEIMEKYDVHRLPVIKNGKLVGIVSRADLIKALID
jgi:CBS domain-containing protein